MAGEAPARIGRLTLDAPEGARGAALSSLDGAFAEGGAGWLIVRRLAVEARGWDLGERTSAATDAARRRAVSGWSGAAASADAVSFDSLADLLACLSRDLASGRGSLWFWAHVFAPPPRSVAALWADHALELPEVAALAAQRGALAPVLASLHGGDVARIFRAVAARTGWSLPPAAPPAGRPAAEAPAVPLAVRDVLGAVAASPLVAAVATLRAAGPVPEPVIRLVAVLLAWSTRPLALSSPARAAITVAAVSGAIGRAVDGHRVAGAAVPPGSVGAVPAPASAARPAETPAGVGAPAPVPPASAGTVLPAFDGPAVEVPSSPRGTVPPPPHAPRERAPPPPEGARAVEPASARRGGTVTACGGWFYLINALHRPDVADLVRACEEDGWLHVLHAGRLLGEPDETLAAFLADRLGVMPQDLAGLAPPAEHRAVVALLERRYAPLGIWDEGLLAVPALVTLTRTHLDVHMRLADARVAVRRAGLDVDPGWVDWLGLVVAFHYGHVGELAGFDV